MNEQTPQTIKISLDDGVELQIPEDQARNTYGEYLKNKYSQSQVEQSAFREGESPDEYIQRLENIYPKPEQLAYLRAINAIAKPASYGPYALQGFAAGVIELDPEILRIFPPQLNSHILGKGFDNKDLWYLEADKSVSSEVISACNLGAYTLRKFGNQKVHEARQMAIEASLGRLKIDGIKLQPTIKEGLHHLKIKAAEALIGNEMLEDMVRKEVEGLIDLDTLGLLTEKSAKTIQGIGEYIGGPFSPIQLLAESLTKVIFALDDLDIYPEVGRSIMDAYNANVDKPTKTDSS